MKRFILLLFFVLPLAAQFNSGLAVRVRKGAGTPASGDCVSATDVGKVWINETAAAPASSFYVCANTGVSTYAWELGGGGGSSADAYEQSFTGQTSVVLTPPFATDKSATACYDASNTLLSPSSIQITGSNTTVTVTFSGSTTGKCVVISSGRGATGAEGPAGAPNTSVSFTAATDVTWSHNENTVNALYTCYNEDDEVFEPNTITTIDENTVEITFSTAATGYCVGNFAGGAGGGNPLFANVQSGTNTNALVIGTAGTLTTSGTGTITANRIPSGAQAAGYVDQTAIAEPSSPSAGAGRVYIDSTTKALCTKKDDGSTSCTGAPGGGSVLSVDGTGGNGVETIQGGSVAAITTSGSIRAASAVNTQSGTSYLIDTGDRGKLIVGTNAGAMAYTLPQAGSSFPSGWYVDIKNGTSTWGSPITVTPTTSTIDGATSLVIGPGLTMRIRSDGTNYTSSNGFPMFPTGTADGTWWAPWGEFHVISALTSGAANRVYMFLMQVPRPIKVSKISFRVQTAAASTNVAFAIYQGDATKLVESAAVSTAGSNGDLHSATLASSIVLTPGLYTIAYASDSTSNAISAINDSTGATSLWTQVGGSSGPQVREWFCANAANLAAGTIFPASCGAHTAYSATSPPLLELEN